jgi:signal transduction histidine kinase
MTFDDAMPMLRADERKLKQVLLNLVSNAVKFTPAGGRIEVATRRDPAGGLTIAVRDTGIGIPPEHIATVLQPFVQVDNSLSRRHDGTGLGLPLVKAIAELHGGALRLASEVQKGTTVEVTFPPERIVEPKGDEAAPRRA